MIKVLSTLISTVVFVNLISPVFCMDEGRDPQNLPSHLKNRSSKFTKGEELYNQAMKIFHSKGVTREYIALLEQAAEEGFSEAETRLLVTGHKKSPGKPLQPVNS